MSVVIRFDQISKRYQLGLSRTSIVKAITQGVSKAIKPGSHNSSEQKELWALRDVSFELSKGESLALVGRNGAGKSTILKLLANITHPTSGTISVDGRLSALLELGSGFHPDLTGRENIFLNGTILGLSRRDIQRRYDEIVDFSEIERFIETPVKRYSSGMLVRLGFAVASCIEPDILLVDEVLAVGDTSFRQKCLTRIQSLLDNGTGIIFVSHNLYMVQSVCPQAIYLDNGVVKSHGETSEVIKMYDHDIHRERTQKTEAIWVYDDKIVTDVHISEIALRDKDGQSRKEFSSREALEFQVHYYTYGTSGPANAEVRIVRTDGVACCILRTTLDDVTLTLQDKDGTFSAVMDPLQLAGGMYFADVRIINEQGNVILAAASSEPFYVEGRTFSDQEQTGIFEPHGRWIVDQGEGRSVASSDGDVQVHLNL